MAGPWEKYQESGPWDNYAPQTVTKRGFGSSQEFSVFEPGQMTKSEKAASGLRNLAGPQEAFYSALTGALAEPVAGYAGLAAAAIPGGRTGPEAVQATREALTYQPRTRTGQAAVQAGGDLMHWAIGQHLAGAGGKVTDVSGMPGAGAATEAGLAAIPMILGARMGLKGRQKAPPKSEVRAASMEKLRADADALYTAAEESGVIISRESFTRFVDSLQRRMASEGVDAGLHPKAVAMLKRLEERKANNFTLKGAEIERRNIGGVAGSVDAAEARMGSIMRNAFDDYVNKLKPADTLAGDPKLAYQHLNAARQTWKTLKKAEIVDDTIQLAYDSAGTYTGAGFENALRVQFRNVVKKGVRNKRFQAQFTPDEWAMMRKVANGGPMQNVLRWAGKLSIRSPVGGGVGAGLGFVTAGPIGAVAVPVAAEGAKLAAAKVGIRNANKLYQQIASEGPF